jgi:hypothetical protein
MKQSQIVSVWVIFLFIAFSCRNETYKGAITINNEDFGEEIYLAGEQVDFDEPLMKPVRMLLIDSIFLFYNMNMDPLIHRYNLNTLQNTGECISFGGGPDDLMNICSMQIRDSTIWLTDRQKRLCLNFRLSDICYKDTFQSLNRISTIDPFNDVWIFPDHRVLTIGFNQDIKRFSSYSPEGTLIQTKGDYPSFGMELTDLEKVEGFTAQMAVNYPANRIYVFNLATDLLEIYDLEGKLIKQVHGPDHFFPVVQEKRNDEMIRVTSQLNVSRDAFGCPVIVNDEIFVLYAGTYFTKESHGLKEQLFVYDREGNPLRRYKLSEKIFRIVIDAGNRLIYGISDNPEFHLVRFHY